jgi:hypothetical protein
MRISNGDDDGFRRSLPERVECVEQGWIHISVDCVPESLFFL